MDNAMVKRGIGAVVLAIIAALLLGYLLKDKSRERQEIVEMDLPGSPEIKLPSLSNATESAASLVGEAKETVSNAGSSVIGSVSGTLNSIGSSASNAAEAVTDGISQTVEKTTDAVSTSAKTVSATATTTATDSANPGFSFRPSSKNDEQQINTSGANNASQASENNASANDNDTVIASTTDNNSKKNFKPVIENEPKKTVIKKPVKRVVKKKVVVKKAKAPAKAKPKAKAASSTASNGRYAIQLLATSSQSRAQKLANTMKNEGYVSFITQTKSNNKILYRVRVGAHKDRSTALSAQEKMKRRYQKNFSVQNSLVVSQ